MFHFHFKGLEDKKELRNLIEFLVLQDLGYPNYESWVQKTEHELESGYKGVVLAFSGKQLVGDIVYQPHKAANCFLEIKNLRMHPQIRERKFAEFMLRQIEAENKGKYSAVICDARANQKDIISFLESQKYNMYATLPLYDKHTPDVVMIKFLDEKNKLVPLADKIIRGCAI